MTANIYIYIFFFSSQFIRYYDLGRHSIKKLVTHLIRKHEDKGKMNISTEGGLVFITNYPSRYPSWINFYKVTRGIREKTNVNFVFMWP